MERKLVPQNVSPLPAKPAKPMRYGAFEDFVKLARLVRSNYLALTETLKKNLSGSTKDLEQAERQLANYEKHGRRELKQYETQLPVHSPDAAYDDDNAELTKAAVATHVAALVGSFPNANPADPEVYTMMMIEEIINATCFVPTLNSAVRRLRRTSKFLPAISEVLEVLEEEDKFWGSCGDAAELTEEMVEELKAKVAQERQRLETQEEKRNRIVSGVAQKFADGERVRHDKFGAGTVVSREDNKYTVQFDKCDSPKKVVGEFLEHHTDNPFAHQEPNNDF